MLLALATVAFAGILFLSFRAGLLSTSAIAATYVTLGAYVPFLLATAGLSSYSLVDLTSDVGALALSLVIVAFAVALASKALFSMLLPYKPRYVFGPDRSTSTRFAIISFAIYAAYFSIAIATAGGLAELIDLAFRRTVIENSALNYAGVILWGGFMASVAAYYYMPDLNKSSALNIALVSLSCIVLILVCMISGSRTVLVQCLFAIGYKQVYKASTEVKLAAFLVTFLIVFMISSVGISVRYSFQGTSDSLFGSIPEMFDRSVTGLAFIDHVALAINYATQTGFDYGASYLKMLTYVVPRSFWPDKPLLLAVLLREFVVGDTTGGIPPGYFGEAYIAFGGVGVVFSGVLFGFVLSRLDAAASFSRRENCVQRGMLVAVFAPLCSLVLIRTGLDVAIYRAGIPVFWFTIFLLLARRTRFRRLDYPRRETKVIAAGQAA